MDEFARDGDRAQNRPVRVTARQRDVLRLVALGYTNRQIGALLDISKRTVDMHRAHGMQAIQARSLAEVVRWAQANGLFPARDP